MSHPFHGFSFLGLHRKKIQKIYSIYRKTAENIDDFNDDDDVTQWKIICKKKITMSKTCVVSHKKSEIVLWLLGKRMLFSCPSE